MTLTFVGGVDQSRKLIPTLSGETPTSELPSIREITIQEVADSKYYSDMAELAVIFNHGIVGVRHPNNSNEVWRWKTNGLMDWLHDYAGVYTPSSVESIANGRHGYGQHSQEIRASLSLNTMWGDFYRGAFPLETLMKFYMQIGYSLSGFGEVFGQKEAADFRLPGALTSDIPNEDRTEYVDTFLDYVRRTHKGKVLQL